jgi:hypothetical protein
MKKKYPIYYYEIEQGTEEWKSIRKGKMTASNAQAIATAGKGLETYINDVMAEYYANAEKRGYNNIHLEAGHELEPVARELYSFEKGAEVKEAGFIDYSEFAGCSPDGLVGDDGGLEIKSPDNRTHFQHIIHGEKAISSAYLWQIQMNLFITGRKWWDYVSYSPNYDDSLLIFRILPDKEKFKKIEAGLIAGEEKIKNIINLFDKRKI